VRVGQQCGDVAVVTSDEYHDKISVEPVDLRAKAACHVNNDKQVSTNVTGFTEMPAFIAVSENTLHTKCILFILSSMFL